MRTGEKSNKKQAAARMTKKVLIIVLGILPGSLLDWCVFAINSAFLL